LPAESVDLWWAKLLNGYGIYRSPHHCGEK
jgi:hypothetical protein